VVKQASRRTCVLDRHRTQHRAGATGCFQFRSGSVHIPQAGQWSADRARPLRNRHIVIAGSQAPWRGDSAFIQPRLGTWIRGRQHQQAHISAKRISNRRSSPPDSAENQCRPTGPATTFLKAVLPMYVAQGPAPSRGLSPVQAPIWHFGTSALDHAPAFGRSLVSTRHVLSLRVKRRHLKTPGLAPEKGSRQSSPSYSRTA